MPSKRYIKFFQRAQRKFENRAADGIAVATALPPSRQPEITAFDQRCRVQLACRYTTTDTGQQQPTAVGASSLFLIESVLNNIDRFSYGQFIASTLPAGGTDSGFEASLPFDVKDLLDQLISCELIDPNLYNVYVRNRCLNILANSLVHTSGTLNSQFVVYFYLYRYAC